MSLSRVPGRYKYTVYQMADNKPYVEFTCRLLKRCFRFKFFLTSTNDRDQCYISSHLTRYHFGLIFGASQRNILSAYTEVPFSR